MNRGFSWYKRNAVSAGINEPRESDRLLGFFTPSKTGVFYTAVSDGVKKPNKRSDSRGSFIPAETAVFYTAVSDGFIRKIFPWATGISTVYCI
jgi:hypothetical protein